VPYKCTHYYYYYSHFTHPVASAETVVIVLFGFYSID